MAIRLRPLLMSLGDSGYQCDQPDHIGRITYVGRDLTSTAVTKADVTLEVQEVYSVSTPPVCMSDCSWQARFSLPTDGCTELVLVEDRHHYIRCPLGRAMYFDERLRSMSEQAMTAPNSSNEP
ncbi:hypothetical protein CCMA1212_003244 [Trichoderma ghanense]|uniref:Uncharacterized protein n=1 Tax=Trichoderma ghanense TaxID=65468 RepID=A0ABY2HC70_9HYPO